MQNFQYLEKQLAQKFIKFEDEINHLDPLELRESFSGLRKLMEMTLNVAVEDFDRDELSELIEDLQKKNSFLIDKVKFKMQMVKKSVHNLNKIKEYSF